MGYKRKAKTYRLTFDDPELAGFEIVLGSLSIGEFTQLSGAMGGGGPEAAEGITGLLEKFASKIVRWNLEDEAGQPVPADYPGVQTQDMDFIMAIVNAWMTAIAGVDPTSQASANGTGTFPEVSLPMDTLSASPLN